MLVQGRNSQGPISGPGQPTTQGGLLVADSIPVYIGSGARTFRTTACHKMNNSLVPCRPEPDLGATCAGWTKILAEGCVSYRELQVTIR